MYAQLNFILAQQRIADLHIKAARQRLASDIDNGERNSSPIARVSARLARLSARLAPARV